MKRKNKKIKQVIILIILAMIIIPILYSASTKNPLGTNISGNFQNADIDFFYDLTYLKDDERKHEHNIFNAEMKLIENAKDFLIIDLFLYNDEYDKIVSYPNQVSQMTDLLITKKKENKDMPILFITDPINNFYGAYEQKNIRKLRENGIDVIVTDLNKMRDSNILVSGGYRAYFKYFGTGGPTWIRNFFQKDGPKVNLRSIFKLANFKGNHRKVLISENEAIVASANPHDPSSYHSNVALRFVGEPMEDLIKSESIFFEEMPDVIKNFRPKKITKSEDKLRIITECGIRDALLKNIENSKEDDKIHLGIFYISEFDILKALGQASDRNVDVKIIADLNKDAFGLEKNGTPNRPALSELKEKYPKLEIKFYNTSGEQFHTKIAYFKFKDKNNRAILGSANFTRRNLDNFNLETDVEIEMNENSKINKEIKNYFERIWNNEDAEYTLDLNTNSEDSLFLRTIWKIQERTGLCTW
ncbi:phospholipase D-like domain-containing protein [Peptoniphilus raoultii]|uniref:phospholipase D-like domain-containing protein n=1 Tax=Peptoniphilus raoultii TaxID=1776387 RepID=UPI0008D8F81B|nr:phospholipase D-like domain-containing protein [Peptoniphilus raoultii]